MIRVVSGWHPAGKILYGDRFLETFHRHWPLDVDLKVYVEERHKMPRDACRLLWDIPGATFCRDTFVTPRHIGREPNGTWKRSCIRGGYNFRHDIAKFWKQILIPNHAAQDMNDGDILIWLDGDVVTTATVKQSLIVDLLGKGDVCFLGREDSHSEIGFWAIKLSPLTREFLQRISDLYTTREIETLPEGHSAFAWDWVRKQMGMREVNLTPRGRRGHVWPYTPLATCLRHDKGKRKGIEK